jgi:hypothetical protein
VNAARLTAHGAQLLRRLRLGLPIEIALTPRRECHAHVRASLQHTQRRRPPRQDQRHAPEPWSAFHGEQSERDHAHGKAHDPDDQAFAALARPEVARTALRRSGRAARGGARFCSGGFVWHGCGLHGRWGHGCPFMNSWLEPLLAGARALRLTRAGHEIEWGGQTHTIWRSRTKPDHPSCALLAGPLAHALCFRR